MKEFDKAFEEVNRLAFDFKKNIDFYTASNYQESEVRNHFINKFFKALGWDVLGDYNTNPYEQEVKVEKTQRQQGSRSQKRADYAFYKSPNFKDVEFFVEAKKPSVELKSVDNYFQTIRYGWNAQTPIAVLTDFEQFHIIDCRAKPDARFVFNGKHKEYTYLDYFDKEKFAEIYWLFSKEAVQQNSLRKYAATLPKVKGKVSQTLLFKIETQAIDNSFLAYIDNIRELLAKAFKKNDESLNSEQLTEAVQRTIDRLVFIRFLEDKLIEGESHVNEWTSWKDFVSDCRKLDAKYNGIVFKKHFIDDQYFAGAEEELFRDICQDISSLNSPYDFNYIPIHILGSIYERFLGKVVVATNKRVHIDEKPEVRKAGGVYYTPKYIVDYIVKNTIGNIIEGKTPKQIAELKFADIACGSGSFLIGIYDYLLDYHKKYYSDKLAGRTEIDKRSEDYGNVELRENVWTLTLKIKQEILLNNIFGVDIDPQAVEVSQLSLFLKMLEDETLTTTHVRQGLFFSKVLPDLSKNVVCGNSLIGYNILQMNGGLFEDEELRRINPMDFSAKFASIIHHGGFNAIIGNPPYVDIKGLDASQVDYYFKFYTTSENRINLYSLFIEKALSLLNKNGALGYIVPNSILYQSSYLKLRKLILSNFNLHKIVRVPDNVFIGVKAETAIFTLTKENPSPNVSIILYGRDEVIDAIDEISKEKTISQKLWQKHDLATWDIYGNPEINAVLTKIEKGANKFSDIVDFCLGLTPYDKYKGHTQKQIEERVFHSDYPKNATFKKLIEGANVQRYFVDSNVKEFISYGNWLGAPREKKFFTNPRILVRQIVSGNPLRIFAGYTEEELFNTQSVFNILNKNDVDFSLHLLTALLNSTLMNFYHKYKYLDLSKNLFQKILIQNCKKFPIPKKIEKQLEKSIIALTQQMYQVKLQQLAAKTEKNIILASNMCDSLELQIDNLIFDLYKLTDKEREIIRNN